MRDPLPVSASPRRRVLLASDAGAYARELFATARRYRRGPSPELLLSASFLTLSPEAAARDLARGAARRARSRARYAGHVLPSSVLHNGKARRNA